VGSAGGWQDIVPFYAVFQLYSVIGRQEQVLFHCVGEAEQKKCSKTLGITACVTLRRSNFTPVQAKCELV
jgi:hypothetical protein